MWQLFQYSVNNSCIDASSVGYIYYAQQVEIYFFVEIPVTFYGNAYFPFNNRKVGMDCVRLATTFENN